MRQLLVVGVLLLGACGDDDDTGGTVFDAGPEVIDGGEQDGDGSVAECVKPTEAYHGFVRETGGTRSRLLRIGKGVDAWDEEVGAFVLAGGGNPPITQLVAVGENHFALAEQFLMGYDPTAVTATGLVLTDVAELAGALDVAGPADPPYFLGVRDNQIFCIDSRDGTEVSLGSGGTACAIVAIRGNCEFTDNGAFAIDVIADCPAGATRLTIEKQLELNPEQTFASPPFTGADDVVGFPELNLVVTNQAELYDLEEDGFHLRRKTRLCVGPGNPFNGQQQAVTGME